MTSKVIQWKEEWFSVEAEKGVEEKGVEEKGVEEKEVEEKEVEEKEEDRLLMCIERQIETTDAVDALRSLLHTQTGTLHTQTRMLQVQSEELDILRGEVKALQREMKAMKAGIEEREREREREKEQEQEQIKARVKGPPLTDLLDSWKRLKERELNYAIRRHQPVPFFPLESMMRWERAIHPSFDLKGHLSPLFRHQRADALHEKDMEELLRGMEAVKL